MLRVLAITAIALLAAALVVCAAGASPAKRSVPKGYIGPWMTKPDLSANKYRVLRTGKGYYIAKRRHPKPPRPNAPPPPLPEPEPLPPPLPGPSAPLGIPGSWALAFADEFNGTSLDHSRWQPNWLGGSDTAVTNNVATDSLNCYDPARVSVAGGNLRLAAIAQSQSCGGTTRAYSSGLVNSAGRFENTYGVYEARILMPVNAAGQIVNWPTWWTNGHHPNGWPQDGEIDIAENLGGSVFANYHSPGADVVRDIPGQYGGAFHTFAIDRQAGFVRWYYDGVQVAQQTAGMVSSPHYLILNQEIAPAHGGPTSVPATMLVDYVRVWR